jgi:hypothetical protein
MSRIYLFPFSFLFLFSFCGKEKQLKEKKSDLFNLLSSEETGISFKNALSDVQDFDVFRYRNFYNGGGVGIGDINNDGLADVFFTSNMGDNKLYLNKGNWKFEDITSKAKVAGTKMWSTGVAMADVNGDGLLDIYVCNSGNINGDNRENELFINNGDLTFTEKAKEFGLADKGFTTHAVFFDFDKDGDLDCYILNNSFRPIGTLGYRNLRDQRDPLGGHKLMQNNNGHYEDISEKAGIYGSVIGFGLGVTVGDVNNDNWPDMYISNDFYERDYLYINQHDGTFSEELEKYMGHLSMFSMGADMADIDNDGNLDIFSTDMLPDDDGRLKQLTAFETYDIYQQRLSTGYYHQFMRNMLQLNRGDNSFVEVGQMAGVDATDWSWGALMADFNNDGNKEILVCNGIFRDVTDQDYIEYMGSDENIKQAFEGKKIDFSKFVNGMSSTPLRNYLFQRDTLLHFKDISDEWGLSQPTFSNGAAYGDLDNDGDLDLVINNLNMESFVYRNEMEKIKPANSISINFNGEKSNRFGVGSKVKVYSEGKLSYSEHMPMRGFQSSMDYKMTIGVGKSKKIDSLIIIWPNDKVQVKRNIDVNQKILVNQFDAVDIPVRKDSKIIPLLKELKLSPFKHKENNYIDFNRERLIFSMLSTEGPALAIGDINNDGLDDLFVGGAKGQSSSLIMQSRNGDFNQLIIPAFLTDSASEDVDAIFFDADNDKDLDLYVVTGGTEFSNQSSELKDHLYINKSIGGKIDFVKSDDLPSISQVGSCVAASDIDHDGDVDLFVGTRVIAGYYGLSPSQYILINDGKGKFTNETDKWCKELSNLGMVTDAQWSDLDKDGWEDLIIVGEWMPLTIFKNEKQKLNLVVKENDSGWWNTLHIDDFNGDGRVDLVLGNLGWNSRFRPSKDNPIKLFVSDFDGNGSTDPIYTYHRDGKDFPYALRQDIIKQIPSLKKKFLYFKDYAGKNIEDIFSKDQLSKATLLNFQDPSSSILLNKGDFNFIKKNLPWQAQVSPIYSFESLDFNNDGKLDLIAGGNLFGVKPEIGRYDGLEGLLMLGDGNGGFTPLDSKTSGIKLSGEIRKLGLLKSANGKLIAFGRNNESLKIFKTWK